MYPHRIRLRGPWTLKTGTGQFLSVSIDEGLRNAFEPTASAIQLCRRFSWLHQFQPHERLWLVLEQSAVMGATLNEVTLELTAIAEAHQECEITSLARRSNSLALNLPANPAGPAFPQVALEVRCRTFLRQPTWHIDTAHQSLEIGGLLVGANESPLDLYVRVGEVNVLYTPVHADKACSRFRYQIEIRPHAMTVEEPIQIDLVKDGVIWHRVSGLVGSHSR